MIIISCSAAKLCLTLCYYMDCSMPGFLVFTVFLNSAQIHVIESVMLSNCLILCHPLLLLPSIMSSIRVFSNGSALCLRWPKHWSFSISPSNEQSWLSSFRIGWLGLLAVFVPLRSLITETRVRIVARLKSQNSQAKNAFSSVKKALPSSLSPRTLLITDL